MSVIDVVGIDLLRCLMETLLDERIVESEDCDRRRQYSGRASGCNFDSVTLTSILPTNGVHWAYKEALIVFEFDSASTGVAVAAYRCLARSRYRCDTGCIVGSLAALVRRVALSCLMDTMSRDLVMLIVARLDVV